MTWLRRHGGVPPTPERLAELAAMSEEELAANADRWFSRMVPDSVFDSLVRSMRSKGDRRDKARCSICGGPPNPTKSTTICTECLRERKNADDWMRRFNARKKRRERG